MARRHGLGAAAVDVRNSGDTAGPRDRVVGYGAFVFQEREKGTATNVNRPVVKGHPFVAG